VGIPRDCHATPITATLAMTIKKLVIHGQFLVVDNFIAKLVISVIILVDASLYILASVSGFLV
jgi:hypothetical protein